MNGRLLFPIMMAVWVAGCGSDKPAAEPAQGTVFDDTIAAKERARAAEREVQQRKEQVDAALKKQEGE